MEAKKAGEKSNDSWGGATHVDVDSRPNLIMDVIRLGDNNEGIESSCIEIGDVAGHIQVQALTSETKQELIKAILQREEAMMIITRALLRIFLSTALIYIGLTTIAMFFPVASVEPLARLERLLVIEAGLLGSAYWWKHRRSQEQN